MITSDELFVLCKVKEKEPFLEYARLNKVDVKFFDPQTVDLAELSNVLFLVCSPSSWTQKFSKSLASMDSPPIIAICPQGQRAIPDAHFASIKYVPLFWNAETSFSSLVKSSTQLQRRLRRSSALQKHQNRGWDYEKNPALFLITNLIKESSLAEQHQDTLRAVISLRAVLDFQFGAIYFLNENAEPSAGWQAFTNQPNKIQPISKLPKSIRIEGLVGNSEPVIISLFSEQAKGISSLGEPWSSALAINIIPQGVSRKKNAPHACVVILFRNELLPFTDRDAWLLELSLGPLTLALEKTLMLESISEASKEWRSTFDAISEPMTVIDESFSITKANRSFAKTVDIDIKSLKGRKCYTLLTGRRTPCANCSVNRDSSEQGRRIADKKRRDFLVWSFNVKTRRENFNFQFYRNLEKENQLRSVLIQAEKMAALGKLVGSIAHEVNNPLAGILSTCQLLLDQEDLGALRDDVQEIHFAAQRAKAIIGNLLGFTEQGKSTELLDVRQLIETTLSLCKSAVKQVKLKIECQDRLPPLRGSSSVFQQILFNLATNALHAMDGAGSLFLRASDQGDTVKIEIADTGPGIASDKIKYIFDPFHTSKAEGQGTGLGLSIVRNLTRRLGGEISVKSELGRGTSFFLSFPKEVPHG